MMQVLVDRETVNDESVVVRKIYAVTGALVAQGERVLEFESSKTVKEVAAPEAGMLTVELQEGDEVPIGGVLFTITPTLSAAAAVDKVGRAGEIPGGATSMGGSKDLPASDQRELSNSAKELLGRLGIEPHLLPTGWVTAADVLAASGSGPAPAANAAKAPLVDWGPDQRGGMYPAVAYKRERMSLRKRAEGKNLARANGGSTHSLIGIDVTVPGLRIAEPPFLFQDSITDIVVFELARLLRHYPELNAFHIDDRSVGYYQEVNVGISFDSGANLQVLALSNADTQSLATIHSSIESLLHLYESGERIDEALLNTSTVTISDLSREEAQFMMPLLNVNQSLILGITKRAPGLFGLHATFDHRVSEGLQVAKMLGELRSRVVSHFRPTRATSEAAPLPECSICGQTMLEEKLRGGRGLLRVILTDGSEGQMCGNCFHGW